MAARPLVEEWTSPEWRARVTAWVDAHLSADGTARVGDLELVRLRPWGIVLRTHTSAGTVFMKATAPGTAFEAGLYEVLARLVPDRVLLPVALDVEAGWLLLPDGGPILGEQHGGRELVERLVDVAGAYGQLQVDLAPHVDELFAVGVADMRPARMAERFDEALAVARGCVRSLGLPDRAERVEAVARLAPTFGRWCDRLVEAPGRPTLDHNDLHGGNVFLTGPPEAPVARFFDWGDAVVAHPFASALVLRSVVRWLLDVHGPTPSEDRVLAAYLEPFAGLGPRDELLEVLEVACEVGKVARALVWARAVARLPPDAPDPDGFAAAPLDWLLELLEGPLGDRR